MDHYEVLRNKSQVYNAGLVGGYADTVCIVTLQGAWSGLKSDPCKGLG
jgi:hypothetical protein